MTETRNDDQPGNGELSAAYRARSAEMPPAELDARILAAAHRAVGSRPGGRRHLWFRWIDAPLATAAVVLVSATLMLLMREEGMLGQRAGTEARRATATQEKAVPAPAATAIESGADDVAAPTAPPQARASAEEETGAIAPRDEAQPKKAEAPASANATISPEAGAAAPAPPAGRPRHDAPAPAVGETAIVPGRDSVEGAGTAAPTAERHTSPEAFPAEAPAADTTVSPQAMPPTGTPDRAPAMPATPDASSQAAPAGAPPRGVAPGSAEREASADDTGMAATAQRLAKEKAAGPAAQTPEERWLQEIRELVRAGKFTDAQLSLARFVKAYPDYQVPADILEALKPAD